tara:strand:+ start:503 stop:904 length:402 start_codon:yes stop_codon:yes gene_type:complete
MSTIKANTLLAADGTSTTQPSIPALDKRFATAWVNFNGQGTVAIRDSYNVSSITDGGTGRYTANFTTAMTNANYSASGSCGLNSGAAGAATVSVRPYSWATSAFSFTTNYSTASLNADFDFDAVNVTILGGQA